MLCDFRIVYSICLQSLMLNWLFFYVFRALPMCDSHRGGGYTSLCKESLKVCAVYGATLRVSLSISWLTTRSHQNACVGDSAQWCRQNGCWRRTSTRLIKRRVTFRFCPMVICCVSLCSDHQQSTRNVSRVTRPIVLQLRPSNGSGF